MPQINRLKELRAATGKTAVDVAKESDVSEPTINRLENDRGKARLDTLGKLARYYNVPLDTLYDFLDTSAPDRGRQRGKIDGLTLARTQPAA